jgi:hypothetical protein
MTSHSVIELRDLASEHHLGFLKLVGIEAFPNLALRAEQLPSG